MVFHYIRVSYNYAMQFDSGLCNAIQLSCSPHDSQALIRQRNLITLAEVAASLSGSRGLTKDVALLGSPLRFPFVREYFWPDPSVTAVPQISSLDVLNYLEVFSSSRCRRVEATDCDEFLEYLCTQRCVASPQHLCVRIANFGALLGALFGTKKTAQNSPVVSRHLEAVRQTTINRIRSAFETLLSSSLRRRGSTWKLRRPLSRMQPLQCLREVAANYACLVDTLREATDGLTGLAMQASVAAFLRAVESEGPLAAQLLHLALCATADSDSRKLRREAEALRRRMFGLDDRGSAAAAGQNNQKHPATAARCSKCQGDLKLQSELLERCCPDSAEAAAALLLNSLIADARLAA
uniref:GCP_N_terminal domain-containing protein n=1 Tax=Macrostomum lignano TaxID=282301 RepID=A0A1I8GNN9_9PLAT